MKTLVLIMTHYGARLGLSRACMKGARPTMLLHTQAPDVPPLTHVSLTPRPPPPSSHIPHSTPSTHFAHSIPASLHFLYTYSIPSLPYARHFHFSFTLGRPIPAPPSPTTPSKPSKLKFLLLPSCTCPIITSATLIPTHPS